MGTIYGYCRISRRSQNIERQERNIKAAYPTAYIFKEAFTGTKIEGRKQFELLDNKAKSGDTIVFDSVSRISRNAEDGIKQYMEWFNNGVNLVFLKEPHINTDTYKHAIENRIESNNLNTGDSPVGRLVSSILNDFNTYFAELAKEQIRIAFEQAQKEVDDLHQRTAEGLVTARINGKQIGQPKGAKLTTKKSIAAKKVIEKYSKDFSGSLEDEAVITLAKISRNTYYKYKRQMRLAIAGLSE